MVFVFKSNTDADRFYRVLEKRLNKYGIEMHHEKSQKIPAGSSAAEHAHQAGTRIPVFKFLGFICYWGRSRFKKLWRLKLKSRGDRKRAKLKGLRDYLWKNLHTPNAQATVKRVIAGVRGWVNYHSVSDNQHAVSGFLKVSRRILFEWFNRRGKKRSMNWKRFSQYLIAVNYPSYFKTVSLFPTPKMVST